MQAEEERKRPHMRPRTGNGDRRVVSDASRAENFGYGRDLRSLTRWQWSVMVTGERPTIRRDASFGPSPAIISTVTYAHVVHVLAIYRLPRELRLGESEGKYVSLKEESHDAGEREPDASYVHSLRDAIEIPRSQFECAGIPVGFIFLCFLTRALFSPIFCFTFEILRSLLDASMFAIISQCLAKRNDGVMKTFKRIHDKNFAHIWYTC